jgi:hypothetical protein
LVVLALLVEAAPTTLGAQRATSLQGGDVAEVNVQTDSDPTRPVFFSVRPELYRVGEDVSKLTLTIRYDTALLKTHRVFGGAPGVILRFEVPAVGAEANGQRQVGLGDAYGQFLVMPYVKGGFGWVVGSGFVLPTATDTLLGGSKWVLAPVAVPVWRFPRGLFFVKVQNFASIAGDPGRPDLNFLLVTPTLLHVVRRVWWVLADSETRTTWAANGRTGVKSGLQLGRRIAPGVGFWIKPEVWWGPNRDGQWNLKFGLIWYQAPGSGKRT